MARSNRGPLANSPRDLRDDAVGEPAEEIKTAEPPRWPPNPKKVKKNNFHAKVSGKTSRARADRAPHFRRGGFVSGSRRGDATEEEEPFKRRGKAFEQDADFKRGGSVKRRASGGGLDQDDDDKKETIPSYQMGGGINPNRVHTTVTKTVPHGGRFRHRVTASRTVSRDPAVHPVTGRVFREGGKVRKRQDGGSTSINVTPSGSTLADDLAFASQGTGGGGVGGAGGIGSAIQTALGGISKAISPQQQQQGQRCAQLAPIPKYPKDGGAIKKRSGGHITTAQRKALPSGDFALPGKGTGAGGKGPGSYPIDTENRARNALARGAQHASPAEQATIKRKVKAKYPDIDVGGD